MQQGARRGREGGCDGVEVWRVWGEGGGRGGGEEGVEEGVRGGGTESEEELAGEVSII